MTGITAALLGDLDVRKELGKVGTRSDIHLHDYKENVDDGIRDVTVIVPDRYPDKPQTVSFALLGADAVCMAVSELTPQVGEQILAADAAGIRHGIIVLQNYLQPEQIAPLLQGTVLEGWPVQTETDWPTVRAHLAAAHVAEEDGPCMVPVDHHFDVTGVGAVVLGVVRQGTLHKGDTLHAWPGRVICPVRSIQVHDRDVPEAHTGDRVGLALRNTKADQLDRGMVLAPEDAPLRSGKVGQTVSLQVARSPFSKQPLGEGSVLHLGFGMQFVPARLQEDAPATGQSGTVEAVLEKPLVTAPGEHGIAWHLDAAPQRVVGRATLG